MLIEHVKDNYSVTVACTNQYGHFMPMGLGHIREINVWSEDGGNTG